MLVGSNDGDGDAPESELVCSNVVKLGDFLGLDEVFEVIDGATRRNLDRERVGGSLSIIKAEQGEKVVGHGVAEHPRRDERRKAWKVEVSRGRKKEEVSRRVKESTMAKAVRKRENAVAKTWSL